jgi:tetratricopeptide (TPR) repeat protein
LGRYLADVSPAIKLGLLCVLAAWTCACVQVSPDPKSLVDAGYAAALRGDAAKTIASYERAIAIDPAGKGTRVSYGWALFNLELYTEALAQWTAAYQGVDRGAPNLEVCLALACYKLGRKEEALEWYAKQVRRDERFDDPQLLEFATGHWTAKERAILQDVFRQFRQRAEKADPNAPR